MRSNLLRSSLTVLGIAIGVAAVVSVTALSDGARTTVGGQISQLGSNVLIVFPRNSAASGARDVRSGSRLSDRDIPLLLQGSTSIAAAAPVMFARSQLVSEGQNVAATAIGTTSPYFDMRQWYPTEGRLWSEEEQNLGERVVLLGAQAAKDLFPGRSAVDQSVRIGRHSYRVLAVLAEKGTSPFGQNQDEVAFLPIRSMRARVKGSANASVDGILVSATREDVQTRAQQQTEEILRAAHGTTSPDDDDFVVRSQAEFKALQDTILGAVTLLLIGVAAISLAVGGIGVMNIMLVSVTERTREIGIRMAVGARERDILLQFLLEALLMAIAGGAVGTALAWGVVEIVSSVSGWPMQLSGLALAVALGVSTGIGLVFGLIPAAKAARLEPVKALGRE